MITFCQRIFDANTEKKPYTIREFARRDLGSALANLWQIKGLVYKTIFHEVIVTLSLAKSTDAHITSSFMYPFSVYKTLFSQSMAHRQ